MRGFARTQLKRAQNRFVVTLREAGNEVMMSGISADDEEDF